MFLTNYEKIDVTASPTLFLPLHRKTLIVNIVCHIFYILLRSFYFVSASFPFWGGGVGFTFGFVV